MLASFGRAPEDRARERMQRNLARRGLPTGNPVLGSGYDNSRPSSAAGGHPQRRHGRPESARDHLQDAYADTNGNQGASRPSARWETSSSNYGIATERGDIDGGRAAGVASEQRPPNGGVPDGSSCAGPHGPDGHRLEPESLYHHRVVGEEAAHNEAADHADHIWAAMHEARDADHRRSGQRDAGGGPGDAHAERDGQHYDGRGETSHGPTMDIASSTIDASQIARGSHGRSGLRIQGASARGLQESGWWGDNANGNVDATQQSHRSPGGGGVARGVIPTDHHGNDSGNGQQRGGRMSQIELERLANRQKFHNETSEKPFVPSVRMIPSKGAGVVDGAAGVASERLARETGRTPGTLTDASPYRSGMKGSHVVTALTEQVDPAEKMEIASSRTVANPGPFNRHAGGYNGHESGAGAAIHGLPYQPSPNNNHMHATGAFIDETGGGDSLHARGKMRSQDAEWELRTQRRRMAGENSTALDSSAFAAAVLSADEATHFTPGAVQAPPANPAIERIRPQSASSVTPRRGADTPDRPSSRASGRHTDAQHRSMSGSSMAAVLGGQSYENETPRAGGRLRKDRPLSAKIGSLPEGSHLPSSRPHRPATDSFGTSGTGGVEFGHRAAYIQRPSSARSTRPW